MILRKLLPILLSLLCVIAVSCSKADYPADNGGTEHSKSETKITPAEYTEGELAYSLTVSDGKRSVILEVVRRDGMTEAVIASPESMAGVNVVYDAGGARMTPPNGELLSLTEEGAVGMCAFFDAMAHPLGEAEKKSEGMYRFELSGYEVTLLLSEDGYPKLISLAKDGYTRHGEVTFPENGGVTS